MRRIALAVMLGMVGLVFFFGDTGVANVLITDTSTGGTAMRGFLPIAWATGIMLILIMGLRGERKQ